MIEKLRAIAEGPALDLPPVTWEPPNHIGPCVAALPSA